MQHERTGNKYTHTNMAKKTSFKFNGKLFGSRLYKRIADEQTERLKAYAASEIVNIVLSKAFDDRTKNLADSYVWCVYFQGKRKGSGTYGKKGATKTSLLHEFSPEMSVPVDGRKAANEFVKAYKPTETSGWEIVFAACAPYGAYLEGGFTLHGKRYQFDVMSQRYDQIKNDLSPLCKVTFMVNPPKY